LLLLYFLFLCDSGRVLTVSAVLCHGHQLWG
jgi:hypothetical protein